MAGGLIRVTLALIVFSCLAPSPSRDPEVLVEVEEPVYTYQPADNGAGPLWCYGSTCLARVGEDVFISGLETIPNAKPLNNVRWTLFKRSKSGWELQQRDERNRTREPSPIAIFPDGRLFLSANPTITPPDTYSGPARPEVLRFDASNAKETSVTLKPEWEGAPVFTEHSYRGFGADASGRELLIVNNLNHEAMYWSFMDRKGQWSAKGRIPFPMGVGYEKPEPIRLCYPQVALRRRAAHLLAISDIIEPVKAWREFKLKINNGRPWDYEFRRLFYIWTPDITRTPFKVPVEVASREKTAGQITNLDLWLDSQGRAHLLWLERSVWYLQMRDRFFPGTPLTTSLEYAVVDRGTVTRRNTLWKGGEGASPEIPGYGRFHALPGGRLMVLAYFNGQKPGGAPVSENRLLALGSDGAITKSIRVPFAHPFTNFMTATERAGSPPSNTLDILGDASSRPGISYARIEIR